MGGFLPDFWSIDFDKLTPDDLKLLRERLKKELEIIDIKAQQLKRLLERVDQKLG